VLDLARDGLLYLDTSALMKLVVDEAETRALQEELRRWGDGRFVTSALTGVELPRSVRRAVQAREGEDALRAAVALLDTVIRVPISSDVITRAASLEPATLRSLDAIHLASAMVAMPRRIPPVVCGYDERLQDAARVTGSWLSVLAARRPPASAPSRVVVALLV
jgi:predicted nucleic acid-binding protein